MHMHHPALSEEFKFGISAKGKAMKPVKLVNNPSMIFARIFSPPKICLRARARGLRGGWSLDNGAMCPVTSKK